MWDVRGHRDVFLSVIGSKGSKWVGEGHNFFCVCFDFVFGVVAVAMCWASAFQKYPTRHPVPGFL